MEILSIQIASDVLKIKSYTQYQLNSMPTTRGNPPMCHLTYSDVIFLQSFGVLQE